MPTSRHRSVGGVAIATESSDPDPGAARACDVLLVHATGFCKELWRPVVAEPGMGGGPVSWTAMDQRGHGDSDRGEPPYRWSLLGADVGMVAATCGPAVGVGHSSGGAAVAMAEIASPGTFSRLVLIEPIITPPPYERRDFFLAQGAERRRARFPDRDNARERFGRGPFSAWDPRVLDLYVDHAFRDVDGERELKCAPEVEAEFYREGYNHDTWDHVGEIAVPVTIVSGEHSDSHTGPYLDALVARFHDPEVIVVPDAGHLVPMERPEVIGGIIAGAVAAMARDATEPGTRP